MNKSLSPSDYLDLPWSFRLTGNYTAGGILEVSPGRQFSPERREHFEQLPRSLFFTLAVLAQKNREAIETGEWERAFSSPIQLARSAKTLAGIGDGDAQVAYSLIADARRFIGEVLNAIRRSESPVDLFQRTKLGYRLAIHA